MRLIFNKRGYNLMNRILMRIAAIINDQHSSLNDNIVRYPSDFTNILSTYNVLVKASESIITKTELISKPKNVNQLVNNIKYVFCVSQQLFNNIKDQLYKGMYTSTFNTLKSNWNQLSSILRNIINISDKNLQKIYKTSPKVKRYYELITGDNGYLQFFDKFVNNEIDDIKSLDESAFKNMKKQLQGTWPQNFIKLQEQYKADNEGNNSFENYIKSKFSEDITAKDLKKGK